MGTRTCKACEALEVPPALAVPVPAAANEVASVRVSFDVPWADGGGASYLLKPSELMQPVAESSSGAGEQRLVKGRPRSRRELVLDFHGDIRAAREAWNSALSEPTELKPPPFASCLLGHLFHARCYQGLIFGGKNCPACGEALCVPSSTIMGGAACDDASTSCGGGNDGGGGRASVVQAAVDEVTVAATVVRAAAAAGSAVLRGATLRMCPTCYAGPLLNENCADLQRHHGECSKCRTKISNAATTIAACIAKLKKGERVYDVLPQCTKCCHPVTFNGCGSCGCIFTSLRLL